MNLSIKWFLCTPISEETKKLIIKSPKFPIIFNDNNDCLSIFQYKNTLFMGKEIKNSYTTSELIDNLKLHIISIIKKAIPNKDVICSTNIIILGMFPHEYQGITSPLCFSRTSEHKA